MLLPGPLSTFTTPGGTPHSANPLAISSMVRGVGRAGFRMLAQPAAIAGATFCTAIMIG